MKSIRHVYYYLLVFCILGSIGISLNKSAHKGAQNVQPFAAGASQSKKASVAIGATKSVTRNSTKQQEVLPIEVKNLAEKDIRTTYDGLGKNFTYSVESLDVNHDTNLEFIIDDVFADGEQVAGSSGNQVYFLYAEINAKWKKIAEIQGNRFELQPTQGQDYPDIESVWSYGASKPDIYRYVWNSTTSIYEESKIIQNEDSD